MSQVTAVEYFGRLMRVEVVEYVGVGEAIVGLVRESAKPEGVINGTQVQVYTDDIHIKPACSVRGGKHEAKNYADYVEGICSHCGNVLP